MDWPSEFTKIITNDIPIETIRKNKIGLQLWTIEDIESSSWKTSRLVIGLMNDDMSDIYLPY